MERCQPFSICIILNLNIIQTTTRRYGIEETLPSSILCMKQIEMDSSETQEKVVEMCQIFHMDAQSLSHQFLKDQQRHFYVTPTSFLELLGTYKQLLTLKRSEVKAMKTRYSVIRNPLKADVAWSCVGN